MVQSPFTREPLMTLKFETMEDERATAQLEDSEGRQPYTSPSIRSGSAFEPVLAATCTDDDPEDDDCAPSPPSCFS